MPEKFIHGINQRRRTRRIMKKTGRNKIPTGINTATLKKLLTEFFKIIFDIQTGNQGIKFPVISGDKSVTQSFYQIPAAV
jgi:hypothetical protein